MEATMIRVLIPQDEYFQMSIDRNITIAKTGKLQMQVRSGNEDDKGMVEKGFKFNKDSKCWERPKIGGVLEDNIGEILGYVFDQEKYDANKKRKKEHYIEYDWTK